jgi:uncharacterized membrane protein
MYCLEFYNIIPFILFMASLNLSCMAYTNQIISLTSTLCSSLITELMNVSCINSLKIKRFFSVKWSKRVTVRFEVLTAAVMKTSILWDMTPCVPLKVAVCVAY